jgi:nicotinamidase/pyrazinamidase
MEALIIVDVQNDFLPNGALAVANGDEIIPFINSIQPDFELIIATIDWHPLHHSSFAVNNEGTEIGEVITLAGLNQIMWPAHCVQHSVGAALSSELDRERIQHFVTKGEDAEIDSYSGFFDNGRKKATGLNELLMDYGVTELTIVGLAADYCVKYTALDAKSLGYKTKVLLQGTRAVNMNPTDLDDAIAELRAKGVEVV